jgi:hypothetical protein
MQFVRHLRYEDLPSPECTGEEHKDEVLVREFDEAFDRLAAALSELYLVDTEGGCGIEGAPISMCRYVDIYRQHTLVVERQAWHPDVIRILHQQLQQQPAGWTFAIDATEFPPGQAHIVVEQDGTVHGWCDFSASSTLSAFGFNELRGLLRIARFKTVSFIDRLKRK